MNLLIHALSTFIIGYVFHFFLPWWAIALAPFIVAFFIKNSGWVSFFGGCIGAGCLWLFTLLYIKETSSLVLIKMNDLFPFPVIWVTIGMGFILGGLCSYCGFVVRTIINR